MIQEKWHVGMLAINTGVLEIGDTNGKRIATLNGMDYIGHTKELLLNAKLISAAPELLNALKLARAWLINMKPKEELMPRGIPESEGFEFFEKIIQKAEDK